VAAMATLEFVREVELAVSEMARCTMTDGSMVIGTLNRLAALNRCRIATGKQPYASGHLFTPAELRRLLSRWGTVRMMASPVEEAGAGPLPVRPARLGGPFLVARVNR